MNTDKMQRILIASKAIETIHKLVEHLSLKYTVIFAVDEKTILELSDLKQPGLILIDLQLPEMKDYSICKQLKMREKTQHTPVLVFSDRDETDLQVKSLASGAADYLVLPFNNDVVLAKIDNLLAMHRVIKNFDKELKEAKYINEKILENEARLLKIVDILQHPSETIQEFLDYALKQAIELTSSKIGYIYHYKEEYKEFILNTWSEEVMQECKIEKIETTYKLDKTGIWGEAVRQRRPIMVNDFKAINPLKKGCPEGHVQLTKFLTVPIFKNNEIVGVIGLANKETDYDETDILKITLLMEAVWTVTESKKAEEALIKSNARYDELVQRIPVGIYTMRIKANGETKFEYCSEKFCKMLGLTEEEVLDNVDLVHSAIHPDDRPSLDAANKLAAQNFEHFRWEGRSSLWGEIHWIRIESEPTILSNGDSLWNGVIFDISEQKKLQAKTLEANQRLQDEITERMEIEEALRASEEKLQTIIETSPDGVVIATMEGIVEFVTSKSVSMWGYDSADEIIGRNIMEFVNESYHKKAIALITEMINGHLTGAAEYLMVRKDGSLFYCEANANILRDKNKNAIGILYIERDITERKELENELKDLAIKDQLTGLYNRRKIDEVLMEAKQQADQNTQDLAIIMADIDMFKLVNDQHGHLVGDTVLTAVTKILSQGVRKTDIVGRWGGEEFMIVCPDTDLVGATVLAEKLREMVATHDFEVVGKKTCSFGVAQLRTEETIDELLLRSDLALYRAKERGRNRVETEIRKDRAITPMNSLQKKTRG